MTILQRIFASIALLSTLAVAIAAAQAQVPAGNSGPRVDIPSLLNLDPQRAEAVDAILEAAHEKRVALFQQLGLPQDESSHAVIRAALRAIHDDTDQRLAQVLSAEELARLKATLAPRPRPGEWKAL